MSYEFTEHPQEYLDALARCGAEAVFLAPGRTFDAERISGHFQKLPDIVRMLKERGYYVGCWIQSFGFGNPVPPGEEELAGFRRITDLKGAVCGDAFCPTDQKYTQFMAEQVKLAAGSGADFVLLDDDLCLNIRPGIGCACEEHLRLFGERLGRKVERGELRRLLYSGAPSRERRVWLDLMGETLRDFCRAMRRAADEVNPSVRMGFCAGYTSWDMEGADALDLTYILAGKNRPFLRLSGAPYWAEMRRFPGQNMAHIVEFTRMQAKWCRDADVDFFTENDSYPRPAYRVAAAYGETFDFCMRAAGEEHGLKYMLDYISRPAYETSYIDAHLKNRGLREAASEAAKGLVISGVYVHEEMRRLAEMDLPEDAGDGCIMSAPSFSFSAQLLSGLGIPTAYENRGQVAAAFGHAGSTVPVKGQKGYILDYAAALELEKRGVDTGLISGDKAPIPQIEYFFKANDKVQLDWLDTAQDSCFCRAALREGAKVESVFRRGRDEFPASYTYRNAEGMRFLVFLFRGDTVQYGGSLCRSYYRQAQVAEFCRSAGSPVPAYMPKKPGCWALCREGRGELAVFLCNFSLDGLWGAEMALAEAWDTVECVGCEASLSGHTATVRELPPYGFAVLRFKRAATTKEAEA